MDAIESLILTYNDLNPAVIDELDSRPTALQFMKYVAKNRPFVVRAGAKDWVAVRKWDASYLRQKLQGCEVKVAVTPEGYVIGLNVPPFSVLNEQQCRCRRPG